MTMTSNELKAQIPSSKSLVSYVIDAIKANGGVATSSEIDYSVLKSLNLPSEIVNMPHSGSRETRTELKYRLAWARTYAKKDGLISSEGKKIWKLNN